MQELTHEVLKGLVNYDPSTGIFTWLAKRKNSRPGDRAGSEMGNGYLRVMLMSRSYGAHRLAWFYVTGQWPQGQIDHINGVRHDNRFANLRDVSASVNQQNMRRASKRNSTGLLGVILFRGKYRAQITVNNTYKYLGTFDNPHAAHQAYLEAKRRLHEGCTL